MECAIGKPGDHPCHICAHFAQLSVKYHCWYALGTIPMHRLKQADGFRCISVKLHKSWQLPTYKKPMTPHISKVNDIILSILMHQTLATPSVLSLSHLLPSLPLFLMLYTYLWSSFPIAFHILFYTAYYHFLTITLPIHCLVVISWALMSILPII
jgi:hypothetical protein